MDDHKLNAEMGKLCGQTLVESDTKASRWLLADSPDGCLTFWNPVDSWELVCKFVIPALQRADCIVELEYDDSGVYMEIKPACGGWIAIGAVISLEPPPRSFCEIALEAAEKLEETTWPITN